MSDLHDKSNNKVLSLATAAGGENRIWVACPLCKQDAAAHHVSPWHPAGSPRYQVVCCQRCGLLYTNPRPPPEALSEYYNSNYYAYSMTTDHKHRVKRSIMTYMARQWLKYPKNSVIHDNSIAIKYVTPILAQLIRRQKWRLPAWKEGGRLLDVGCGWGEYPSIMSHLGWQVVGVEISRQAVVLGQEKYGLDVRCGTVESQQFPDQSFDVVTLWDVLEHLAYPSETLSEIYRILRPEGWLLITVPNSWSLQAHLFGDAWAQWDLPRHLSHFNSGTVRTLLNRCGFLVRAMNYMSVPTTTASSMAYYLNARFGIPHWQHPSWLKPAVYVVSVCLAWISELTGRGDTLVIHAQPKNV